MQEEWKQCSSNVGRVLKSESVQIKTKNKITIDVKQNRARRPLSKAVKGIIFYGNSQKFNEKFLNGLDRGGFVPGTHHSLHLNGTECVINFSYRKWRYECDPV